MKESLKVKLSEDIQGSLKESLKVKLSEDIQGSLKESLKVNLNEVVQGSLKESLCFSLNAKDVSKGTQFPSNCNSPNELCFAENDLIGLELMKVI